MITLKKAFHAYNAIIELMNEKMSFKDAYTLLMAKKELEYPVQFFAEKEHELVDKYAIKNEDGKVVLNGNQFQMPKDKVEDFTKEHDELDSIEVAVDLKEKTLHGFSEIKPSVLEALMELFDFEE